MTCYLTSHAAPSPNVLRAFLLVKNGIAFCSSAAGVANTLLSQLIPANDISKTRCYGDFTRHADDAEESAALALWVGKPGDQNSGIFVSINANLIAVDLSIPRGKTISAVLRWPSITPLSPPSVIGWWIRKRCITRRSARHKIDDLPLKVYLYANSWLAENTQFALLLAASRLRPAGGAALLLRA
ncbi:CSS-motif domain-containing protein [Klebsiella pneumoniae]|nr:CSS-motif domain-containing protein [Klebsiella pneumoniae]